MTTLLILHVVSGLFLASLSIPLLFEKIPPNPLYGFRLGPTLSDPKVWYATNKHAAKRMMAAGLSLAAAAIALRFVPAISLDVYALSCLAIFAIVFGVGFAQSLIYMKALARRESTTRDDAHSFRAPNESQDEHLAAPR